MATKELPPFVIKTQGGQWEGVSIEIWEAVAENAGLEYVIVEDELTGILDGVESGDYEAGLSAITLTGEREERFDFSHAYFSTGLGIAVSRQVGGGLNWYAVLKAFFTWRFLSALAALLVVLLAAGFLLWIFERQKNQDQFGGRPVKGIGDGFWWSAVTMTTVGYGDKAPVTLGGRIVALVWMFTSVIVISSFTASIATSLTVNSIGDGIESVKDLHSRVVGTVGASTSESFLETTRARIQGFETIGEALAALERSEVEAVVYDRAVLQYWIEDYAKLELLPASFESQSYAIAMNVSPELRERINIALLEIMEQAHYRRILERYGIDS